jgi:Kef-type K+ transport system membrane component KefB/Trk K+ transport system NAD-binding subunit
MENIFSGLSLIIVIGAVVAFIMRKLGQPLMIGHIITGILVGPAIFHIADDPESLRVFADIGIALLLFIIGLGMNPRVVKEVGKSSTITSVVEIICVSIIGWMAAVALGLERDDAIFIGVGLAINSTIVALKLLSDKKEQGRLYGKLTIGTSLVEDILVAIALLFIAASQNGNLLSLGPFIKLTLEGALIGLGMYLFAAKVLPKIQKTLASDQELLFLFAIAWGLGSGALLAKIGFSLEVGAFAAGIFLASFPYAQEIASRLRPLRDFFVIVFFIALGTGVSFAGFGSMIWMILAGLLIVLLIKPLIVMSTLGFLGYTKRVSFKTATMLTHVSEFSIILVILGERQGLIQTNIVTILTFVAIISIAASTYLVTYNDKVFSYLEKYLEMFERRKTHAEAVPEQHYELVLFGYQRGGHEFVSLFKKLKKKYVVIDYDPDVVDTMDNRKVNYIYGDATDEELLEEAGVQHAKLVVSTIPDFDVNSFLLKYMEDKNPRAVLILHADDPFEAAKFYEAGASYVILPHYIGSEQVSAFIGKSGLSKEVFRKQRIKHLEYLEKHYGALEKLNQIHEKKLGRTIVRGVTAITTKI